MDRAAEDHDGHESIRSYCAPDPPRRSCFTHPPTPSFPPGTPWAPSCGRPQAGGAAVHYRCACEYQHATTPCGTLTASTWARRRTLMLTGPLEAWLDEGEHYGQQFDWPTMANNLIGQRDGCLRRRPSSWAEGPWSPLAPSADRWPGTCPTPGEGDVTDIGLRTNHFLTLSPPRVCTVALGAYATRTPAIGNGPTVYTTALHHGK